MADTKLSALGSPVAVDAADLVYVVQGGVSKATNLEQITAEVLSHYTGTKGPHVIPILAGSMQPAVTNGCAALATDDTVPNLPHLAFDAATQEYAEFCVPMPVKVWEVNWVRLVWTGPTSGDVVWSVQTLTLNAGDTLPATWGTASTDTEAAAAGINTTFIAHSVSLSNSGDAVYFRISRDADAAGDTAAGDVKLIRADVCVTTTLETDD